MSSPLPCCASPVRGRWHTTGARYTFYVCCWSAYCGRMRYQYTWVSMFSMVITIDSVHHHQPTSMLINHLNNRVYDMVLHWNLMLPAAPPPWLRCVLTSSHQGIGLVVVTLCASCGHWMLRAGKQGRTIPLIMGPMD